MKKKVNFKHITILIIVIIAITYIFFSGFDNNVLKKNEIISHEEQLISFDNGINPIIVSTIDDNFYNITGNSIKMYDLKGNEKWSYVNNYNMPSVKYKGEYISVRESKNANSINVFNSKGLVYGVSDVNFHILDVSINKSGYIAVLSTNGTGYTATVYDNAGNIVVTRVVAESSPYPVSISLSDDNRIFAIASINTDGLSPQSNITLSYVSEKVDNKETDVNGVFAGTILKNEIVGKIEFVGVSIITYSNKGINIYKIQNDVMPEEPMLLRFENYIKNTEIVGDKYILVAMGAQINNNSAQVGSIFIYDFFGKEIGNYTGNGAIGEMSPANNGVIVTLSNGKTCFFVDTSGKELWEYIHDRDINKCVYVGKKVTGLLVENDGIRKLDRKK